MGDVSIPRLRRIRYKDGRVVEVFRPKGHDQTARNRLSATVTKALASEVGRELVAFALVGFAKDGSVYVDYENSEQSTLMAGQIPQVVKDILVAELGARWAN